MLKHISRGFNNGVGYGDEVAGMLGVGFNQNSVGSPAAGNFDPSTVAWTGWFRETYTNSGANVTQWTDKSGNANHLTAASNQPTVGSTYLGFPTFAFGTSKKLQGSDITAYMSTTAFTVFVVANATAANTTQSTLNSYLLAQIFTNQVNATVGMGVDSVGPAMRPFAQEAGGVKTPASELPLTLNEWDLYEMRLESGILYTRKNSLAEQSIACGTMIAFTGGIIVGSNYNQSAFYNGSMIELAFINTALSSGVRQNYRTYAVSRYGIV